MYFLRRKKKSQIAQTNMSIEYMVIELGTTPVHDMIAFSQKIKFQNRLVFLFKSTKMENVKTG